MKPYTKMMLATAGRRTGRTSEYRDDGDYRPEGRYRGEYGDNAEDRFRDGRGRERYDDGRYAPDSPTSGRFRDNRGREHYDNGRFAPQDRIPPIYQEGTGYRHDGGARLIGFYGGEIRSDGYGSDARYEPRNEMGHSRSMKQPGHASSSVEPMDRKTAQEWVRKMQNSDGSTGEHWTYDQTTQVLKQRGIDCDPAEFYALMNAMWSDYCKIAQKFGVDNVDFWADLAKAFLCDKDAEHDKAALYYEYIVKH